ncbi:hypothetical protein IJO12_08620, partial [bacterium]|nr:hypothetical protein [bacterium]
ILTVKLLDEMAYEELFGLKNILAKYHGDDPVMIRLPIDKGYGAKIMTSPIFWVNSTNELVDNLKQNFKDKLEVCINSIDAPLN